MGKLLLERTLLFVKPEAVMRGLVGDVVSRIERKGFNLAGAKLLKMSRAQAEDLYSPHKGKPFYDKLIEHVTSGPILALAVEGPNAVAIVRKLIGSTDPKNAEPGTIRGDYALAITPNIVHASDSSESAARELKIFFKPEELQSYQKPTEATFILSRSD